MRWPDAWASSGLIAIASLAALAGWLIRARYRILGVAAVALALLVMWFGPPQPIASQSDRPVLAVMTGLPLFWREDGPVIAGPQDAPIIRVLRTRFDVRPIDDPREIDAVAARLLLLAQPRAMSPAALVALDGWVRGGGTALLLADPLLRWPSALPHGDRRRPPSVSMIDPLLGRWGIKARPGIDGEIRQIAADGRLMTVSGAGAFFVEGQRAARAVDPLLLNVGVGRGRALLVGDADMIDDRLWLADPARPLDPQAWSADTPALVANWLGAALPLDRRWIRDVDDVTRAIRWALVFGMGWAMLGALLAGRTGLGTEHENKLE